MGRGDVHWNELSDGRFECPAAVSSGVSRNFVGGGSSTKFS